MIKFALVFTCLTSLVFGIEKIGVVPIEDIRVVPVDPTPESNTIVTKIIFPRPYENKRKTPVNVQLRIEGFPLGVITQDDRAKELYNDSEGQTIHAIIDNHPYLDFNQAFEDSFDESQDYYSRMLSFYIPFTLSPGQHIIRIFPVRSYGESLKGDGAFAATVFYFQDPKKSDALNVDLKEPYLTYNEPQGNYPFSEPILLDFLLSNCELSIVGFKVRLSIDGKVIKMLTKNVPYYLYDLAPGKHTVKLELFDENNEIVPGYFNVTEREIEIENNRPNPQ